MSAIPSLIASWAAKSLLWCWFTEVCLHNLISQWYHITMKYHEYLAIWILHIRWSLGMMNSIVMARGRNGFFAHTSCCTGGIQSIPPISARMRGCGSCYICGRVKVREADGVGSVWISGTVAQGAMVFYCFRIGRYREFPSRHSDSLGSEVRRCDDACFPRTPYTYVYVVGVQKSQFPFNFLQP